MIFRQREKRNIRNAAGRLAWFVVAAVCLCEVACGPADEAPVWGTGLTTEMIYSPKNMSELGRAVVKGDVVTVRELLKQDGDIDMREDIQEALHLAVMTGQADVVPLLLARGPDPNANEKLSEAELARLRSEMDFSMPRSSVASTDQFGATHLHEAILRGYTRIAELLIDAKGIDLNIPNAKGRTALHLVAWLGDEHLVRKLLAKGAATDVKDRWGATPLHYGVGPFGYGYRQGRARMGIVRALIEAKSPLNVKNKEGYTPLHKAIHNDCRRIAWLLVTKGAEVDIFSAAGLGLTLRVKKMVRENKKLASTKDANGYFPLLWACHSDSVPLVEFLLSEGPEPHKFIDYTPDPHGRNPSCEDLFPLELAVARGNEEVVKFLLDQGANPNPMGSPRPLYFAIRNAPNPATIVDLLIKGGVDVNTPCYGEPPLHLAAKAGMKDVVEILLDAGANVNTKDRYGKTPLDHAMEAKHKSIVTILTRAAAAQKKIEERKKRRAPITHTTVEVPAHRVKVPRFEPAPPRRTQTHDGTGLPRRPAKR